MQHNYATTELMYKLYARFFDKHLLIELVLSLGKHFAYSMWHTEYINLSAELGKNPLINYRHYVHSRYSNGHFYGKF